MRKMERLGIIAAAASALFWSSTAFSQDKEPIRIGLITSKSGLFQAVGAEIEKGVLLAAEQANAAGGVDGRKVEVLAADDEGNAEAGRREAEKLVLNGHKLLVGPVSSAVTLAISGQLKRWDAAFISTVGKVDSLTGENCNARYFRASQSDAMDAEALKLFIKEHEAKEWSIIVPDYVWGHGFADIFKATATANGGTVNQVLFAPLGNKDYASYITQLKSDASKALWVGFSGADLINFWKQAKQFGLSQEKSMYINAGLYNPTVNALGEDSKGMTGIVGYTPDLPGEENAAFVAAWRAKYGYSPDFTGAQAYSAAQIFFQGVATAGSVEPGKVAEAISGATVDTKVVGPLLMRGEDHQLVMPNYIATIGEFEGSLAPRVQQTVDAAIATPAPSGACKM